MYREIESFELDMGSLISKEDSCDDLATKYSGELFDLGEFDGLSEI